jgi:hypothetical protein
MGSIAEPGETIGSGAMRATVGSDGTITASVVEGTGSPYVLQGTLETDGDFPVTTIRAGTVYNATGTWTYVGSQLTLVVPNVYLEPSAIEVLLQPAANQ